MIIDSLGIVTNNVNFGYAEPMYGGEDEFGLAKGGCSTVFMGQMMYFGGTRLDDKYSKSDLSKDEFIQQVCILHKISLNFSFN